nr:Inner membrane protein YjiY [Klebsiella pneumoniae]
MVDPLGGVKSLWPLFGISNQMLAAVALVLGTVVLVKMQRTKYIWVTVIPAAWLLLCTTGAGPEAVQQQPADGRLLLYGSAV